MNESPKIVIRSKNRQAQAPTGQRTLKIAPQDIGLNGRNSAFDAYREQAFEALQKMTLPDIRDEAWRRTDISKLNPEDFSIHSNIPIEVEDSDVIPDELLRPIASQKHGGQLVLFGDTVQVEVDRVLTEQGVIFDDLKNVVRDHPELVKKICGTVVKLDEGIFASAGSLAEHGAFLYVPRGVKIDNPLHSLTWSGGEGQLLLSHMIVYLEDDAEATLVHESASPEQKGNSILHSGIVEITVGSRANLRFVELQSWSRHVWNFTHERAVVHSDGQFDWIFGAVGSKLTKNFSDLVLQGQGAIGRMSGFYFTDQDQHFDHDTSQNHLAAHTTSDLLFKGALRDTSRSVWQGMIYVAPGAIKADGYQSNRNLVLSKKARADSIPGLEILADDVRCTHGATIGKIDPEPIFYLTSRGIPKKEAEQLVVEGFFDPIMQRIPFDGVRERFYRSIKQKMDNHF